MYRLIMALAFSGFAVVAQTPTVAVVENAADYSTNLCPGMLVSIFGTNFGSSTSAVTLTVGGKPGLVLAVGPTQINAQVPFEAAAGSTTLNVTVAGAPAMPFNITLAEYAPTFYALNGTGTGPGSFLNSAGTAALTTTVPAKPGDTVILVATGLGQTSPPSATGTKESGTTALMPTVTVGGKNATVLSSTLVAAGLYAIQITVPSGVQGSSPVVLTIGGVQTQPSQPVTLEVFGISAIVSNASFGSSGVVSPCGIVTLFGNGFGSTSQSVGFPSTTFQGVSVTFNGTPAPLFHLTVSEPTSTSAGQSTIDMQVPCELPTSGTVQVGVSTPTGSTLNFPVTMAPATPGLYFLADPSDKTRFNVIAQISPTAWLAMPASMATALGYPGNCMANNISPSSVCGEPATPGAYLVLYTTGLGIVTPNGDPNGTPLAAGVAAPADGSVLYETIATPTVTVGGLPVKILFSGMTPGYAGLYQINFQVPTGITGDDVPVVVGIGGSPTDTRTVSIQTQ